MMKSENAIQAANTPQSDSFLDPILKQSAIQGDMVAQFCLGVLYGSQSGDLGVSKEEADKQSVLWYKKAAQQGCLRSKSVLKRIATSPLVFQGQREMFAEYALFSISYLNNKDHRALKWFNRHPKQHLITYCHEFVDQLLSSDKTLNDDVIKERVQFIKQQFTRLRKFFGIFARPYPNDLDKQVDYAVQRVFLYLDLFQRQKTSESMLEGFMHLKKSEYFSSEDTFHLAMYYFRMACESFLEKDQSSAFRFLGMSMMSCAAKMGDLQAKDFLDVLGLDSDGNGNATDNTVASTSCLTSP